MKLHPLLAAALLVASGLAFAAPAATPARPNIVFILADDLGWGDLGCYGQKQLATPNLDRLATEGLRFTRHYAGSTVCAPSRCVLLTGRHLGRAALRTNWDPPMADSVPTIASLLKGAGYATAAFGKWGVGSTIPEDDPNRKGFDEFYGYVDMYHAHNFFPPFLVHNGRREPLRNDLIPGSDAGPNSGRGNGVAQNPRDYAPEFIVNAALRWLDAQSRAKPFFLYVPLNTPHANNEGGKPGYNRGMEVPDFGPFATRDWPVPEKGFARVMRDLDRDVGRIAARLRERGLADNTLVLFSSDNGPHQEGGHDVEFFDSNGSLRGRKRDLYEGGIRVPLIAWWPGRVAAGRTTDLLSGFQDFLPTFAEFAGVRAPEGDGISLVPALLGRTPARRHESLYFEFYEGGGKQAVVTERWKAVRLNWSAQPDGPLELYDLAADPSERNNVAAAHPDVVAGLLKQLAAAHRPHSGPTQPPGAAAKKKK